MENSDDEIDEDETEWKSTSTDFLGLQIFPAASSATSFNEVPQTPPQRVILHFDLDCFYAQVEMIRNPALRNVPLGIQQKYIVVTCNYVARDHGVTKMMSVTDAKEKCPQLVLVKGRLFRDVSPKLLMSHCPLVERLGFDENFMDITEMVERKLKETPPEYNDYSFKGHIFNRAVVEAKASEYPRLAVGSHIAEELRAAIHGKLGLTGCAGIATNKVLAKLVSGTFKPNQQTTLLPENVKDIMGCLSGPRKIPGVGHQTDKRLQVLGLVSVQDLQLFPLADLAREFGGPTAQRLHNLAMGIDDSPVTPTGAPQSLSDEDSFKKMSSTKEVLQKVQDLLSSLMERMQKDGRQPLTFRLTIRRYSVSNKWFSRESRQGPIPNHIGQKITSGSRDALAQLVTMAMKLFRKMVDSGASFHLTLINVCFANLQARGAAAGGKGSIASFFTRNTSPGKTQSSPQKQDYLSQSGNSHFLDHGLGCDPDGSSAEGRITQHIFHSTTRAESPPDAKRNLHGSLQGQSPVPIVAPRLQTVTCPAVGSVTDDGSDSLEWESRSAPNVDPEVSRPLPEDIQKKLLSPAYIHTESHRDLLTLATTQTLTASSTQTLTASTTQTLTPATTQTLTPATTQTLITATFDMPHISNNNPPRPRTPAPSTPAPCELTTSDSDLKDRKEATRDSVSSGDRVIPQAPPGPRTMLGGTSMEQGRPAVGQTSSPQTFKHKFPADVDPKVFSELPPDVQMELLSEWKQQRPVLKTPSKKQGRNRAGTKDRKAAAKGSQTNNLLKYFKPN